MAPPRPRPFITQLSPDTGPRGTTVTIDGGNFSADGSGMYVAFASSALAEITASGETQLTVFVPEGAISGDVTVCVASLCSEGVPFTVTIEPAAVNFVDITSLSYEEGTGSLWIGDRGDPAVAGDSIVYEIDAAGTIFVREGNFNQPFISNPSVEDGSGRIYYSNGLVSNFNSGTIKFIRSADNTIGGFRDAGEAVDDPVWARGMVASPHELDPPTCYFLDGNNNTIRREPRLGLEDPNWGNFTFNFNDPAGGRFDSAGNLYVTSTTEVYKIAPDETISLVASGFTAAAGMDLIEMGDLTFLAVADEATGEIVQVVAETGETWVAADGYDSPAAVVFARDPGSGMLTLVVAGAAGVSGMSPGTEQAQANLLYLAAPGYLEFERCTIGECRILLSKAPSNLQTGDTYPNPGQSSDGEIVVAANVGSKLPVGTTIYFRLRDPADSSPYLSGMEGDNEPSSPAGNLVPLADSVELPGGVDVVGTALEVDPDHSGNNYVIEASLMPEPNFDVLARSETYTTWRRVYYEHDRMFKAGSWIVLDSGAGTADPTQVFVDDPSVFVEGEQVWVISAQDTVTKVGEVKLIAVGGIQADRIVLDSPLTNFYPGNPAFPNDQMPYSFVGKVSAGAWDSQPTEQALRETFGDPFTEWNLDLQGSGRVPLWPHFLDDQLGLLDARERVTTYFDHYVGQWGLGGAPERNFVQLMSARQHEETLSASVLIGRSFARNVGPDIAPNWSAVFVGTIGSIYAGSPQDAEDVTRGTTSHELAHQLNVNPPVATTDGHDTEQSWDGSGDCLMNVTSSIQDRPDRSLRFHADPAASSQDLFCIRTHLDDLNEDTCTP